MSIVMLNPEYKGCRIRTADNQECQRVCELTSYCYGWSRGKSGSMNEMCCFKGMDGWKFEQNRSYDSATKSTGVIQNNTRLKGQGGSGNFVCDEVNPVHPAT